MMENDYIAVNRQAYDRLAEHYRERRQQKSEYEEGPEKLAGMLTSNYLGKLDDAKYLEVGPGSGEVLSIIEGRVAESTAVELSLHIINLCKEITSKTKFIHSNILESNFSSSSFDLIYLGAIIHLFPKKDATILMERLFSWLSNKGLLFINTTIAQKSSEGYYEKRDSIGKVKRFRKCWIEEEFIQFIVDSNFRILKKYYTQEDDRSKVWVGLLCDKNNRFLYEDTLKFQGETSSVINRRVSIYENLIDYEVTKRSKFVLIIPVFLDGTTILVYQYRSAINDFILEFPAGKIDLLESSFDAAHRELEEETGYKCRKLEKITEFFTAPHFTDELVELFIARDLYVSKSKLTKKEFIYTNHVKWEDLYTNKSIVDSKTLAAINIFDNFTKNEKI